MFHEEVPEEERHISGCRMTEWRSEYASRLVRVGVELLDALKNTVNKWRFALHGTNGIIRIPGSR